MEGHDRAWPSKSKDRYFFTEISNCVYLENENVQSKGGTSMTKVITVQAQQMWEYVSVNRKTEEFLVEELNEKGKAGWELVSVTYHKDLKGLGESFSWSAFLKRPLVPTAADSAEVSTAAARPTPAPPAPSPPESAPPPSDEPPEMFDFRSE